MKKLTISVLVLAVFSVQGFTQGGPCFQMTATDMALLAPLSWQPIENIPQGDFVRKISSLSISFIKDIELAEEAGINRIKPKKTEVKKTKRQYVSLSGYVRL